MSNTIKLTNAPLQSNDIKVLNPTVQKTSVSNTNSIAVGATDHSILTNRDLADQHPISAITGLQEELDSLSQGVVYTPSVSSSGIISWTNNGGLENPTPVNIKGAKGEQGIQGIQGIQGERGLSGVYVGTGDMPADCNVQIDPNGSTEDYVKKTDLDKVLDTKIDKEDGKGLSAVSDISIMGGGTIGINPPDNWKGIMITKTNGTIEDVDFYNKDQMKEKLNNKADKATTLDGYGITDAYTKTEVEAYINEAILGGAW